MKKRKLAEGIVLLVVSALLLFGVPRYVMERVYVKGDSMETTLQNMDNLLVEKVSRYFGALDRFDIVVFYPNEEYKEEDKYYIKRIIGLPGETVQIKGQTILINGEVLEETYGSSEMETAGIAAEPLVLGEDEYFVLGDNRAVSIDSRSSGVGIVPLSRIGGKIVIRIFPFRKFGTVDK